MIAMSKVNRIWSLGCLMGSLVIAAGCAEVLTSYGGPPTLEIVSGPDARTSASRAEFLLVCVSEGDCALECALEGARFEACESPVIYEGLTQGPHLFEARAMDAAGRSSETALWEWTIEAPTGDPGDSPAPPVLTIHGPDTLGEGVDTATLTFQFSEAVDDFGVEDIAIEPEEHTIGALTSSDQTTFEATLNRSGNEAGTITIAVAAGAYRNADGVAGEGASLVIVLEGDEDFVEPCGEVPAHVEMSTSPAVTTFGQPQGLIEFMMPPHPTVLSHPFTTTDDSNVGGQVDLGGASETSAYSRRMWISRCAGGDPLPRCNGEGILGTMRWRQGESRVSCILETETTYYFNLSHGQNSPCTQASGCRAIIQHLGGW